MILTNKNIGGNMPEKIIKSMKAAANDTFKMKHLINYDIRYHKYVIRSIMIREKKGRKLGNNITKSVKEK